MQDRMERGIWLLALGLALLAITAATMLFGARGAGESRAFADAQYVSSHTEAAP